MVTLAISAGRTIDFVSSGPVNRPPLHCVVLLLLGCNMAVNKKDWKKDARHENGRYWNQCYKCKCMFVGHKRRVVCRECDSGLEPDQATTDTEQYGLGYMQGRGAS
jgi:hypothetical protein